jgi:hypothetical protein
VEKLAMVYSLFPEHVDASAVEFLLGDIFLKYKFWAWCLEIMIQ